MSTSATKPTLTRDSWVRGALELLAEGGIKAVAVEPLAARLGTTKGSFYWHFANRDELVSAVLETWTEERTEAIIRRAESVVDPRRRLEQLFADVIAGRDESRVELALFASIDDPAAATAMHEVTTRRVEFLTDCFRQLGYGVEDAKHHALLAYTAHVGLLHGQHATGHRLLPKPERSAYLGFLEKQLVAFDA